MPLFKTTLRSTIVAAITLTGAATTPAKAGDADAIAALLLGAATVAIIANETKGKTRPQASHSTHTQYDPPRYNRPDPRPSAPRKCLRKRWTKEGWVTYYDTSCVSNTNTPHKPKPTVAKPRKPKECLRKRWTENGWEKFYNKRCLRKNGYAVSQPWGNERVRPKAQLPQACQRERWVNGKQRITYSAKCLKRHGYQG